MQESDNHICNLYASVIDIVLNIDITVRKTQQAHECVAQNCIAQMPDMRRLVRIDA